MKKLYVDWAHTGINDIVMCVTYDPSCCFSTNRVKCFPRVLVSNTPGIFDWNNYCEFWVFMPSRIFNAGCMYSLETQLNIKRWIKINTNTILSRVGGVIRNAKFYNEIKRVDAVIPIPPKNEDYDELDGTLRLNVYNTGIEGIELIFEHSILRTIEQAPAVRVSNTFGVYNRDDNYLVSIFPPHNIVQGTPKLPKDTQDDVMQFIKSNQSIIVNHWDFMFDDDDFCERIVKVTRKT